MPKLFKQLLILFNIFITPPVAMYSYYTFSPAKQALDNPPTINTVANPKVLGATDTQEQIFFTVNIPATFKEDISAPNIVYSINGETGNVDINNSLLAGDGIEVTGRTISNTGVLSLVAGDGVSIDGNKITNSGILSLEAGTNISIDGNTITNSYVAPEIDYTQSGWTDNGSTIVLTTTTDAVTVAGLTFDSATITNGNSFLPDTDLGSDIGSTAKRFNNLWVANINSNSSQSFSGQTTFSYPPADTTIGEASVIINPTTSAANGQLLGLAIAGYQKALIDEDGDIILGYSDATSAPASDYPLNIYGHSGTRVSFVDTTGNAYFDGQISHALGVISTGTGNGSVVGDARGLGATDLQTSRLYSSQVASGAYSTIIGGLNNKATDLYSIAGGYETIADARSAIALGNYASVTSLADYGVALGSFVRSNANAAFIIGKGGSSSYLATNSKAGSIAFHTGAYATPAFFIDIASSGGNVGVGNNTPSAKLDVSGDIKTSGDIYFTGQSSSASTTAGTTFYDSDDNKLKVYNGSSWASTMDDGKSASIVVAASDSGDTSKADYVCNGTDDDVTIEAAIAALPAGGGRIMLLEGTYSIGDTAGDGIDITDDNITIEGQGNSTILQRAADAAVMDGLIRISSSDYTVIKNLAIDGVDGSYTSGNNNGIYLEISNDTTISNNLIHDNRNAGIHISTTQGYRTNILNNDLSNNYSYGIYSYGGQYSIISNNRIYTGNGPAGSGAIYSRYLGYSIISNNYFESYGSVGVVYLRDASNTQVSNNRINNHGGSYSVYLYNSSSSSITDNNFYDGNALGISSTNYTSVSGNVMINTDAEITITSGTENYISGNNLGTTGSISDSGTDTIIQQNDQFNVEGTTAGLSLVTLNETGSEAIFTANTGGSAKLVINNNGLVDGTVGGLATYTKAGTISDTDFTDTPVDGLMGFDSTNGRLYIRNAGAWNYIAETAGFQIPDHEAYSFSFNTATDSATLGEFDSSRPLAAGDFLLPFVEEQMEDGALHGLYAKFSDVKGLLFADETAQIENLELVVDSILQTDPEDFINPEDYVLKSELTSLSNLFNDFKTQLSKTITSVTGYFEEIFTKKINTEKLCLGETDEKTCLSQDQVDKLIELLPTPEPDNNENNTPSPTSEPTPEATESATL